MNPETLHISSLRLAKGEVQDIGKRLGCTRQYASEVISAYRTGTVMRGRKASKIIRAYLTRLDRYREDQIKCDQRRTTTHLA